VAIKKSNNVPMKNRTINIGVVEEVAIALQELKDQMVFVGGAVVSLYADDPVADEIRPTSDIDMTIKLLNFSSWTQMQNRLAKLKIYPDPFGHSMCSYKYKDIPLDIIPADDSHIGQSNRWYKYGFEDVWKVQVNTMEIQILPSPCYLASKFDAYNDRGGDYRTSHDFEDIIYVIDNRLNICEEIAQAHKDVLDYLKTEFSKVVNDDFLEDILLAHIHPLLLEERALIIRNKLNSIITS
jgi:hypothetical protein